jgi:mono/diheme cytochrome c family protein
MKLLLHSAILTIITGVLLMAACTAREMTPGSGDENPETAATLVPPPEDYSGKQNPLTNVAESADKGQILYQANCSSCHGQAGRGDGVVARSMEPKPENLAENQEDLGDDYLYWRIAEGGLFEPFRSAMPAWKSLLTEEQIWQIITFIRTLEG